MSLLIAGLVVFIGAHLFSSARTLRAGVIDRMGFNAYRAVFSLAAFGGFLLIIFGMRQAPMTILWAPPAWGRTAAIWLMPLAVVLFIAANAPSSIKHYTRHPMLWGTAVWAALHLLANGDLASLLLFGALGSFALVEIALIGDRQSPELGRKRPLAQDAAVVALGLVIYGLLLYFHRYVSGMPLI